MDNLLFFKPKSQRIKSGISFSILLIIVSYLTFLLVNQRQYLSGLLFMILLIFLIIRLSSILSNKPSVIINNEGIKNNTNMMGLIKWEYIDDFEIKPFMRRKLLIIKLNKQEEFLHSKNFFSRTLMKTNIKKLGSPAVIGNLEFNEPLESVVEKIKNYKKRILKLSPRQVFSPDDVKPK